MKYIEIVSLSPAQYQKNNFFPICVVSGWVPLMSDIECMVIIACACGALIVPVYKAIVFC